MSKEIDKLHRAREIINEIVQGKNPFDGSEFDDNCFLNEPRMIRCFSFISGVLSEEIDFQKNNNRVHKLDFYITEEELNNVVLPEGDIGVNKLAQSINQVIDTNKRKS